MWKPQTSIFSIWLASYACTIMKIPNFLELLLFVRILMAQNMIGGVPRGDFLHSYQVIIRFRKAGPKRNTYSMLDNLYSFQSIDIEDLLYIIITP